MRREGTILVAILVLAAALRLVGLTSSPPGPNQDEISNAIDARFLAELGRDHHGAHWPLYLRGFDDYREAMFVYLAIPLAQIVKPWVALRILAAIVGVATVATTYAAARGMFGPIPAAWSALFLAIDPQHILWSRIGMEVILVPFSVSLVWIALVQIEACKRFAALLFAGALVFTVYSGMMGKPAAAVLAVALLMHSPAALRYLRSRPIECAVAALLLCAAMVPAIRNSFDPAGRQRFSQIRVHADTWSGFLREAARHYATYWSPQYLVLPHAMAFSQDQAMPDLPSAGKLGFIEWLSLIAGILVLTVGLASPRRKPTANIEQSALGSEYRPSLLIFLLLAVVPASITNTIAPSRVLFALPVLTIVMGLGADRMTAFLGRRVASAVFVIACVFSVGLTASDLAWRAQPWLGEFFWNDERRIIEQLATRSDEHRLVDLELPFVVEYVIHSTGAPTTDMLGDPEKLSGKVGGLGFIPLDRILPPDKAAIVTWKDRPMPGYATIAEEGRFKIVSRK